MVLEPAAPYNPPVPRPAPPLTSRRTLALAALVAVTVTGCGARTSLEAAPREDAGGTPGRDAGPPARDAGPPALPDAGPPRRDAGPPGTTCRRDLDCGDAVCRSPSDFAAVDTAPHPLVCGVDDGAGALGELCNTGAQCGRGLCAAAGVCVRPCVVDSDCGSNERCRQVYARTAADAMQPLNACTALIVAPDSVQATGPLMNEPLSTATSTFVRAPLPSRDRFFVWLTNPSTIPFFLAVRAPDGTILYDSARGVPGDPAPSWGVGAATVGEDLLTAMYPNGLRTPRPSGGMIFELAAGAASPVERFEAERTGSTGVFDIDFYLVGGGGLTTTGGAVPPELRRAVSLARTILEPVGLRVGDVRVHEVVGDLRRRLGVLEDRASPLGFPTELPELWRLTAGANRPAVHVFFVRSIEGALGIAAGIPGAQILPGTASSGVAISGDLVPPDELGLVIAHEVGHYMGLFHTSELDGAVNDPHPDTPECRLDRDTDGDLMLLPSECRGAGAENVMFWAGTGPVLSTQQAEIMRRAYFVQ